MTKTSIDKDELDKFDRLSGQWWEENGELKMLHQINPIRIKYISDKIAAHFNSINKIEILDIGCGGGLVTSELARLGFKVTGIDASPNNINSATHHAGLQGLDIEYINTTAEELDSIFDVVLCLEVIEHVANPSELIKNIARLTKPGGIVIMSTLNRNIKSYLLSIVMAENILKWVPKNTHDYAKYIKPSELNNMGQAAGLQLQELKGLNLNILSGNTNNWQLTDDIDVNYFAYFIK